MLVIFLGQVSNLVYWKNATERQRNWGTGFCLTPKCCALSQQVLGLLDCTCTLRVHILKYNLRFEKCLGLRSPA